MAGNNLSNNNRPIFGKVSGISRSYMTNDQDYFEQHFTTELDGGTNYSGIMGNNEYFVRKTPDGKYMYDIQGEDGTIFQGENESSIPVDARKFLDSLYNVGTQRFLTKRHDNGGQIKPNFIKRLEDPNRKSILDWASRPTYRNRYTYDISTHKMGYEYTPDDSGRAIVYPEVQEINGKLVDFTRPPYHSWAGYDSALDRGDYLIMKDLEEARKWVETYKDKYKNLK